jgi:hypothetical protein
LYIAQKEEFSITCCMYDLTKVQAYSYEKKSIFSSERILHKDYDCKGSVEKEISGHESQGA